MSALDLTARGLARRAISETAGLQAELAGPGGSPAIGHRRSEAQAILEPVSAILARLDMSPAGFGALHDPQVSDASALQAFTTALGAAGGGLVRLEPKVHSFGQSDQHEKLLWDQSNAGLIGAGIDRTIIRNVHPSASYSMGLGDCHNALFSDITFHGRMGKFTAQSLRGIIFNRCKFTTHPDQVINAVQITTDFMTDGAEYIYFIDCIFENAGRMNCEITNHGAGTTVRYANIFFIRPRFTGAGQANPVVGMGLSLSGRGDHVQINSPVFDGNQLIQLENAGCSRLLVKDAVIRAATLPSGKAPVSFSNTIPMHDCEVEGLRLVGERLGDLAARPTMDKAFYIESCKRLKLARISAAIDKTDTAEHVIEMGNSGKTCSDVTVENCDLWSNSNKPLISFLNCEGHMLVRNNTLVSEASARTAALLACYGSATAHVSGNRFSWTSGAATTVVMKTGSAALSVAPDNPGLVTRYRGTVTVASGSTTSPLVNHGLPGMPTFMRAYPLGNSGAAWPTVHTSGTQIRANIPASLGASVNIALEAEYAF